MSAEIPPYVEFVNAFRLDKLVPDNIKFARYVYVLSKRLYEAKKHALYTNSTSDYNSAYLQYAGSSASVISSDGGQTKSMTERLIRAICDANAPDVSQAEIHAKVSGYPASDSNLIGHQYFRYYPEDITSPAAVNISLGVSGETLAVAAENTTGAASTVDFTVRRPGAKVNLYLDAPVVLNTPSGPLGPAQSFTCIVNGTYSIPIPNNSAISAAIYYSEPFPCEVSLEEADLGWKLITSMSATYRPILTSQTVLHESIQTMVATYHHDNAAVKSMSLSSINLLAMLCAGYYYASRALAMN